MHPDIALHLVTNRHAEFLAEAARRRLVRETRQARGIRVGQRQSPRRWWWVLQPN